MTIQQVGAKMFKINQFNFLIGLGDVSRAVSYFQWSRSGRELKKIQDEVRMIVKTSMAAPDVLISNGTDMKVTRDWAPL